MDAVDFLKEWRRICQNNTNCDGCYLTNNCGGGTSIDDYSNDEIECITSSVEQWSKENPVKTRQSEFLKMFPNASMDDGILLCPKNLDTTYSPIHGCMEGDCRDCRRDYWLQEVE